MRAGSGGSWLGVSGGSRCLGPRVRSPTLVWACSRTVGLLQSGLRCRCGEHVGSRRLRVRRGLYAAARKCSRRSANVFSFRANVFSSGADVSSFLEECVQFPGRCVQFWVEVFTLPDDALAWGDAERAGNGV